MRFQTARLLWHPDFGFSGGVSSYGQQCGLQISRDVSVGGTGMIPRWPGKGAAGEPKAQHRHDA